MFKKTIINIVAEQLNYEDADLKGSTSFYDDLAIDSDDFLDIISSIEDEFDITFDDEDIQDIDTINDIANLLKDLV